MSMKPALLLSCALLLAACGQSPAPVTEAATAPAQAAPASVPGAYRRTGRGVRLAQLRRIHHLCAPSEYHVL